MDKLTSIRINYINNKLNQKEMEQLEVKIKFNCNLEKYPKLDKNIENLPNEIWKDISNEVNSKEEVFVSNKGRIKKYHIDGFYFICYQQIDHDGYKAVYIKKRRYSVHRLVAIAFIPNPFCYPIVNHKDEIKDNNNVDNLEWCDSRYNANYGSRNIRMINNMPKQKVSITNVEGDIINIYDSISIAAKENNINIGSVIYRCDTDKLFDNYYWNRYIETNEINDGNNQENLLVKIKKLHKDAVIPKYAKTGDYCMDITAIKGEYDSKRDCYVYHTGLAFEIPKGYGMFLLPRSSNRNTEAYMTNHVGVIDSGYRGELLVCFKNRTSATITNALLNIAECFTLINSKDFSVKILELISSIKNKDYVKENAPYKAGDRIAQIVILPYPQIKFIEVEELSESERGEGGHGSTGK